MRQIRKGPEPKSLTAHRKTPFSDYDNYQDKDILRQYLVKEQHGLCCYCQRRIRPTESDMKIEHCRSQKKYPNEQLDYQNLLGACLGGKGKTEKDQHCDTRKGEEDISFSPADSQHNIELLVQITGEGLIKSKVPSIDSDLNFILNLNCEHLTKGRVAVLEAFKDRLEKGTKLDPLKELPKWDGSRPGDLEPYSQVVVYYLRKRIRRSGP